MVWPALIRWHIKPGIALYAELAAIVAPGQSVKETNFYFNHQLIIHDH